MSWPKVFGAKLRGLFGHKKLERELDDEICFHLQSQIDDNIEAGMDRAEARYAALRSFGGVEPMKEEYRDRRAFALIETTARDLRYAVRTLLRSPGFTVTAVVVLALAIGANTAMFSVLNAVLFRPLPYKAPDQLVMLWSEDPKQNLREDRTAYWNIEHWRSQSQSFAHMAFFDGVSATLTTADRAEKISVLRTSPDLFPLLGVQPLYGRAFTADEAEQRQRLALITHRFWQTRFGGSLAALGATLHIDGLPSRIIGVLPPDLEFGDNDVWEPHTMYSNWEDLRRARGRGFWAVMGRLRPNVTLKQAQAEMNAIASRLDEQLLPAQRSRGVSVMPLSLAVVGAKPRLALWMLAGAVFLVLLIAATNVASLSLARSASREREIAVRAALGASRGRIVRQLLAESLTLAVVAGVLGLLVAYFSIRMILAVKPGNLARLNEVSLDPYALGCALVLCLVTGIVGGLMPAITMARRGLGQSGQEGGRAVAGGTGMLRTRRALVVTEFALAIVLLVGAGLLLRSLWSVQNVDLGLRPERVLVVAFAPPPAMADMQRLAIYRRVLEEVASLPGVESTGIASEVLIGGGGDRVITAEGETKPISERLRLRSDEISEELFRTIGTPLRRGRLFSDADGRPGSPRVAIINEAMARQLWAAVDPVGRRFKIGPEGAGSPWFTVVGVVGDMRRQGLEKEPVPQMFEPLAQNPPRRALLLVRTTGNDPLNLAGAVQAAARGVDKYALVYGVTTLEAQFGALLTERRFQTSLLIGFAFIAVLIAAVGIYGLIQYSITMRTREIGIRIAVGAQSGKIFRMIVGEGLRLSLTGLVLGLAGALWLGQAVSSLLFGISPTDPLTFIAVSLLLIAVAIAACGVPAIRAMNVEPIVALRQE